MLQFIVISHGNLAKELINSTKMIAGGVADDIEQLCLAPSDSTEMFYKKFKAMLESALKHRETIVFTDLRGGSPMVAAIRAITELDPTDKEKVSVITGVNLPMLIEIATRNQYEDFSIIDAVKVIHDTGRDGIQCIYNGKEMKL